MKLSHYNIWTPQGLQWLLGVSIPVPRWYYIWRDNKCKTFIAPWKKR